MSLPDSVFDNLKKNIHEPKAKIADQPTSVRLGTILMAARQIHNNTNGEEVCILVIEEEAKAMAKRIAELEGEISIHEAYGKILGAVIGKIAEPAPAPNANAQ
jgi:hypothetical protein